MKRPLLIAAAVLILLAGSFVVARWLNTDTTERARVERLLKAQARGDAAEMLRILDCPDAACEQLARTNARRLRAKGDLKIALYQSQTAHALRSRTKKTRVVWFPAGREADTTVQCVLVRRKGDVFAGMTVSLLHLSAPIGRESSCPA